MYYIPCAADQLSCKSKDHTFGRPHSHSRYRPGSRYATEPPKSRAQGKMQGTTGKRPVKGETVDTDDAEDNSDTAGFACLPEPQARARLGTVASKQVQPQSQREMQLRGPNTCRAKRHGCDETSAEYRCASNKLLTGASPTYMIYARPCASVPDHPSQGKAVAPVGLWLIMCIARSCPGTFRVVARDNRQSY